MKIDKDIKPYLSGAQFSNLREIHFSKKEIIHYRVPFLVELTKGKKVLHVGCCDHIQIIDEKIAANSYLHKLLTDNCEKCIGIDIDQEGIDFLKTRGFNNIINYDLINQTHPDVDGAEWDYIVLGEVLEHVDNPVLFLSSIKKKFGGKAKQIIVTVPFALTAFNFHYIRKGIEKINTDHRFWFTPYTLSKVLTVSGFDMDAVYFVDRSRISIGDKILKWLYWFFGKDVFNHRKFKIYKATGLIGVANMGSK